MTRIALVGSGKVAWQLGKRLTDKGFAVSQVLSRTAEHARLLAEALNATWSDQWSDILPDADWILIAIRDDVIGAVAEELSHHVPGALATHTSGATPGTVLAPFFKRHGVFYPLQTFSQEREPNWSEIPICVDASTKQDLDVMLHIADRIGQKAYIIDDTQRAQLHVAAVFANNFSNHCFVIAEKILKEKGLSFELLHPLMQETLAKALEQSPFAMQTGPALRGDQDTMQRHLQLLEQHPDWQQVYRLISESIEKEHDS